MAANLTTTKTAFINAMVQFAATLETAMANIDEYAAYYFANFQGGAAFVDADFATAAPWMTATEMVNLIATLQALQTAMTTAQRNNFRVVKSGP